MAKKQQPEMVRCRFKQCCKLHDSQELKKEDAVQGGMKYYYHPDCYYTMQRINTIRDLFKEKINPAITSQQIGTLVLTIYNIVFTKHVDVDYLLFAIQYFIKYKPGTLHQPFGLHYIIQDKDVVSAWEKQRQYEMREEIKNQQKTIMADDESLLDSFDDEPFKFKPQKMKSFADILG